MTAYVCVSSSKQAIALKIPGLNDSECYRDVTPIVGTRYNAGVSVCGMISLIAIVISGFWDNCVRR